MALLQVSRGNVAGARYQLTNDRTTLGRHPGNHVVLDNIAVSRTHACVLIDGGSYYIEDQQSRNGTYVNGELTSGRHELADGDEIEICDILLRFFVHQPPPSSVESLDLGEPGPETQDGPNVFSIGDIVDSAGPIDLSGDSSSIVTTLPAGDSGNHLRLGIKPEAKLRAIIRIGKSLSNVLQLDAVLASILDGLFTLFTQAEQGFIMLRSPDEDRLRLRATRVRNRRDAEVNISMTVIGQALRTGEAILSADALADSRFDMSESLSRLEIRSMMCVPLLGSGDERLGVLQIDTRDMAFQFSEDDLDVLLAVANQVSLAIQNAVFLDRLLTQQAIERDLELARDIQQGLLPASLPEAAGYEIGHYYEPAAKIGGDYFDCFDLNDGRICIAIGDVAGKGIAAAILMARLHSAIRSLLRVNNDPVLTLTTINQEFTFDRAVFRFITTMIVLLDPKTGDLEVVNAGHCPMLLCQGQDDVIRIGLKDGGMPIGVRPNQTFVISRTRLEPGSRLLLYTDGITEAMDAERNLFGRVRLSELLQRTDADPDTLLNAIIETVDEFCGNLPHGDDSCLVAVRRTS